MRSPISFALVAAVAVEGCGGASPRPADEERGTVHGQFGLGNQMANLVWKRAQRFALSRRCAQGPFVFQVEPLGTPFGEWISIEIHGGKGMWGHVEVKGGGYEPSHTSFHTRRPDDSVEPLDNKFCVVPPAGPPSASGGGPLATPSVPAPTPKPEGTGSSKVELLTKIGLPKVRLPTNVDLFLPLDASQPPKGALEITLWSEVVLDFGDDAYFIVHQGAYEPVDVPGWRAILEVKRKEEAELKRTWDERQEKIRVCRKDYAEKKVWPPECRELEGNVPERDAQWKACWSTWTTAHEWPSSCRKEFGDGPDPVGGPKPAPPSKPSGPPPGPPAETPPPRPSDNAVWVSGSYTWHSSWVWSPGNWKVPKKDIDEGKTAKAPTAAPAPKVETPAMPPAPGMVWASGHWFFAVEGWIWIAGAWRMPPSPTAKWKVTTYVQIGGKFVLVPGGWTE